MSEQELKDYYHQEGLDLYFEVPKDERDAFDAVKADVKAPIPPNLGDIVRIHKLIREQKSFTVLEFGVGFSTYVIADALKKNKDDWETLSPKPVVRNRFMFKCFTVDSSKEWLERTASRLPDSLKSFVNFSFSRVTIGTFQGQICSYYDTLPDIVPDFVYLDAPDPNAVEGTINGLSFKCDERTVMSGDLLLMEPTFLPGTTILVDGRTNNARFLENNFKRKYEIHWDRSGDVSVFTLNEERLGKYNLLGSDFF